MMEVKACLIQLLRAFAAVSTKTKRPTRKKKKLRNGSIRARIGEIRVITKANADAFFNMGDPLITELRCAEPSLAM